MPRSTPASIGGPGPRIALGLWLLSEIRRQDFGFSLGSERDFGQAEIKVVFPRVEFFGGEAAELAEDEIAFLVPCPESYLSFEGAFVEGGELPIFGGEGFRDLSGNQVDDFLLGAGD